LWGKRIWAMGPMGPEMKHDGAGEGQQQFSRQRDRLSLWLFQTEVVKTMEKILVLPLPMPVPFFLQPLYSPTLTMETAGSAKTFIIIYMSAWHHCPQVFIVSIVRTSTHTLSLQDFHSNLNGLT
jgi:hypothetical protein